jgi:hypothetical protein
MSTAGFDFVAIIGERFLNRALAASFYSSLLPVKFEGTRKVLELPSPLEKLTQYDFSVRLKEPLIVDAFTKGKVLLVSSLDVTLKPITGLPIHVDTDIQVLADPVYDAKTGLLRFELIEVEVTDMSLNDAVNVPAILVEQINEFLKKLMSEGFMNTANEIQVAPVLNSLALPGLPQSMMLAVSSGKADVLSDDAVVLAADLGEIHEGDFSKINDFSEGNDFAFAITRGTLQRVFDYWWEHTYTNRIGKSTGSTDIQPIQDLLDAVSDAFIEFPSKLLSLGFIDLYITIERVWLEYEATARYGKPSYKLTQGGYAEIINSPINMDIEARVKAAVLLDIYLDKSGFIPDNWTNWKHKDLTHRRHIYTLSKFKVENMDVKVQEATGKLQMDESNQIIIKMDEVGVSVDLNWSLPKFVTGWLTERIRNMISEDFPDLYLFPATISQKIPGVSLTVEANVEEVRTLDEDVLIFGNLGFQEMEDKVSPVPIFTADTSTMTVHRSTCRLVEEIKEENKVGYYTLIDALTDGFSDCTDCIKSCKAFKPKPLSIIIKPT